jgi:hypothetical protein
MNSAPASVSGIIGPVPAENTGFHDEICRAGFSYGAPCITNPTVLKMHPAYGYNLAGSTGG